MYCPRCGHQTISDELRFCSYCGLKLGVVKAAIVESEEASTAETTVMVRETRQRDINAGVILMFVGVLLSAFIAGTNGWGLGRDKGGLFLGVFYLGVMILSRPITKGILKLLSWQEGDNVSTNQKGMVFG